MVHPFFVSHLCDTSSRTLGEETNGTHTRLILLPCIPADRRRVNLDDVMAACSGSPRIYFRVLSVCREQNVPRPQEAYIIRGRETLNAMERENQQLVHVLGNGNPGRTQRSTQCIHTPSESILRRFEGKDRVEGPCGRIIELRNKLSLVFLANEDLRVAK